jgi:hypothetical protein
MNPLPNTLVVTTINSNTHVGNRQLIENTALQKYKLIVIGDKKTPKWDQEFIKNYDVDFFSLSAQNQLDFKSAKYLQVNHYGRKILGYLIAAKLKRSIWISETDDDNELYDKFWKLPQSTHTIENIGNSVWVNIYASYGKPEIWHRGIPVNEVFYSNNIKVEKSTTPIENFVVQGIADGDPDIDAICRMLFRPIVRFGEGLAITTKGGFFAPTNSQLTHWRVELLPLMYLPNTVLWRVSDIWRGIIAQYWMHSKNLATTFRSSVAMQKRNEHDLMLDFTDELPVHTTTLKLLEVLRNSDMRDLRNYMTSVYTQLASIQAVKDSELVTLNAYLDDCQLVCS